MRFLPLEHLRRRWATDIRSIPSFASDLCQVRLTSCGVQREGLWRTRGCMVRPWNQDIGIVVALAMLFSPLASTGPGTGMSFQYALPFFRPRRVQSASYRVGRACMHRPCLRCSRSRPGSLTTLTFLHQVSRIKSRFFCGTVVLALLQSSLVKNWNSSCCTFRECGDMGRLPCSASLSTAECDAREVVASAQPPAMTGEVRIRRSQAIKASSCMYGLNFHSLHYIAHHSRWHRGCPPCGI